MRGSEEGAQAKASSQALDAERVREEAVEWFVRLGAEQCSEAERRQFERWLAKSEAHRAAYARTESLWRDLDGLHNVCRNRGAARPKRRLRRLIAGTTAVIALLAGSILAAWHSWPREEIRMAEYVTARGEQRRVTLPDGSTIDLNTAPHLTVRWSDRRREVDLTEGEALFHVAHELARPFLVQVGALQIRALGTRFDVYRKPVGVAVSVLEGTVQLDDGGSVINEVVTPGFQRVYLAFGRLTHREPIDSVQVSAWREGRLVFNHTPLAEVVAELKRYHDIDFRFADPALGAETLSGRFDSSDLDPFLRGVEQSLHLRIERPAAGRIVFHRATPYD